jgi:hypothetical protein
LRVTVEPFPLPNDWEPPLDDVSVPLPDDLENCVMVKTLLFVFLNWYGVEQQFAWMDRPPDCRWMCALFG